MHTRTEIEEYTLSLRRKVIDSELRGKLSEEDALNLIQQLRYIENKLVQAL